MYTFCVHVHEYFRLSICVIVFCMQGAQEVFKELPHEFVSPDSLEDVVNNGGTYFNYFIRIYRPGCASEFF